MNTSVSTSMSLLIAAISGTRQHARQHHALDVEARRRRSGSRRHWRPPPAPRGAAAGLDGFARHSRAGRCRRGSPRRPGSRPRRRRARCHRFDRAGARKGVDRDQHLGAVPDAHRRSIPPFPSRLKFSPGNCGRWFRRRSRNRPCRRRRRRRRADAAGVPAGQTSSMDSPPPSDAHLLSASRRRAPTERCAGIRSIGCCERAEPERPTSARSRFRLVVDRVAQRQHRLHVAFDHEVAREEQRVAVIGAMGHAEQRRQRAGDARVAMSAAARAPRSMRGFIRRGSQHEGERQIGRRRGQKALAGVRAETIENARMARGEFRRRQMLSSTCSGNSGKTRVSQRKRHGHRWRRTSWIPTWATLDGRSTPSQPLDVRSLRWIKDSASRNADQM